MTATPTATDDPQQPGPGGAVVRAQADQGTAGDVDPCATPGPTTTTAATTTVPSGTAGNQGNQGTGGGALARTGANGAGLVGLGLALLAAGGAVVLTIRRNQNA